MLFTEDPRAQTTNGVRISELQLPHYSGGDDSDRPVLLPGSTLSEFNGSHCDVLPDKHPPNRYCWYQDPPSRYTIALAGLIDPCPTDAGPTDKDNDNDQPVCSDPKD